MILVINYRGALLPGPFGFANALGSLEPGLLVVVELPSGSSRSKFSRDTINCASISLGSDVSNFFVTRFAREPARRPLAVCMSEAAASEYTIRPLIGEVEGQE